GEYGVSFSYIQAVKAKAEILEVLEINSAKKVDQEPVFQPGEELVVYIEKDEKGNVVYSINGQKLKSNAGINYNPVPSGYYGPTYAIHYKNLKEMAPILSRLGITKIRVYGLTIPMEEPSKSQQQDTLQYEDEVADVEEIKNIFREVHREHGIRVTLGYWAGVWDKPNDEEAILKEAEKVVGLYGDEDWLLGWVLGNENDRVILEDTPLGCKQLIHKNAEEYYKFQDKVAGVMKQAQGKNTQPIFLSWSYRDPVTDRKVNVKHINYINQMENIDGVLVNAYLDEASQYKDMKDMFRPDLIVGLGEYGMSAEVVTREEQEEWLENITPELEDIFGTLIYVFEAQDPGMVIGHKPPMGEKRGFGIVDKAGNAPDIFRNQADEELIRRTNRAKKEWQELEEKYSYIPQGINGIVLKHLLDNYKEGERLSEAGQIKESLYYYSMAKVSGDTWKDWYFAEFGKQYNQMPEEGINFNTITHREMVEDYWAIMDFATVAYSMMEINRVLENEAEVEWWQGQIEVVEIAVPSYTSMLV
ncbi:MAG: hypothetical protein KAR07_08860, partial [Spirochaetes bacterium]|nr:hypothetical protein [Spirochaetota bacterium]